ncbi:hypothetical protein [Streptomyces specialis]|uniref:hypothetical protein n=1 Tax=Streptomyces specialis TaxID=498367 RepID=UPI001F36B5EE|nr:hypothetical protein [Streptomyces specialis]
MTRTVEGGDHPLLLGTATHARTGTAAPLVHAHRAFGTHAVLDLRPRPTIADHVRACARRPRPGPRVPGRNGRGRP